MASKAKASMSYRISKADTAISNAPKNKTVLDLLTPRGYGLSKLTEGRTILDAAIAAVKGPDEALGAQKDATGNRDAAEAAAKEAYQDLSKEVKALFPGDTATLEKVGLNDPMPTRIPDLISAGYKLFDTSASDPKISAKIVEYGYGQEMLKAERAKFELLDQLQDVQADAVGAKIGSTADEGAAMAALDDWMAQFTKIARVALKKKPGLLQRLGIKARATKTKAQRNAPKKAAATRAAKRQSKASK